MKRKSLKKTVLSGIVALSGLLLLISMSFFYAYMSMLPKEALVAGTTAENGFSMLDFDSIILKAYDFGIGNVLMGAISYLLLIFSILTIVVSVIGIFKFEYEKTLKVSRIFLMLNVVLSLLQFIIGLFVSMQLNKLVHMDMYKTSAFWGLILQAIAVVGYVVGLKFLPEPKEQPIVVTGNVDITEKPKKIEEKILISYAEKEMKVIELLREYQKIYADGIITIMDFEKKKYILMFENKGIDLEGEKHLVDVLKNYRKVYDEGTITHGEYEKKKIQILNAK